MTTNTEGGAPPIIPAGHTMTKRQLLQWLDNVGMDDPITVYHDGWWLNLVEVDANPENLTVILETRDDFSPETIRWEGHPHG